MDAEGLLIATKTAADGGAYVSVMVAEMIVEDHADWPMTAGEVEPSPRDEQVMQLLAAGERDVDIALIFDIGVRTVLGYLDRIRDKTGERRDQTWSRQPSDAGFSEMPEPRAAIGPDDMPDARAAPRKSASRRY